jgi:HK97 family phage major capsid protein
MSYNRGLDRDKDGSSVRAGSLRRPSEIRPCKQVTSSHGPCQPAGIANPATGGEGATSPDGREMALRSAGVARRTGEDSGFARNEVSPLVPKERTVSNLVELYNAAIAEVDASQREADRLAANPDATDEQLTDARRDLEAKTAEAERLDRRCREQEARRRARVQHTPMADGSTKLSIRGVDEPDMYVQGGRSFFHDLYAATLKGDTQARARIDRHQVYEVEQRAITSSTLGGIIPPAYLVDLYAKASRLGRVFADQVNGQPLPDVGMSIILPRLTQGLAAGSQATENTAVSTQDPTETDLTVNVRTIAGYSPVSRQSIERAAYSDQILLEDLIARYWAQLDSQALNGSGASGTFLGLIGTSGIVSVTASTITAAGVYPKIADMLQQISVNMGGIGFIPDKLFMHPRRWAFFCAALDSQNRPFVTPEGGGGGSAFNAMAVGSPSGYGGPVGRLMGIPVFVDGNVPTNLGTNTNEDRIIAVCSPVVHLFERGGDPVTLSFEQQAATSLQVQLVVYGYAAFTAGRYPGASGVITGLTPPSF